MDNMHPKGVAVSQENLRDKHGWEAGFDRGLQFADRDCRLNQLE